MMRYHREFHNGQKRPLGLIAWSLDYNTGTVNIGWSLCHPDDQFIKREARNIANQKRTKSPISFNISNPKDGIETINKLMPHTLLRTATYVFGDIYTQILRNSKQKPASNRK